MLLYAITTCRNGIVGDLKTMRRLFLKQVFYKCFLSLPSTLAAAGMEDRKDEEDHCTFLLLPFGMPSVAEMHAKVAKQCIFLLVSCILYKDGS